MNQVTLQMIDGVHTITGEQPIKLIMQLPQSPLRIIVYLEGDVRMQNNVVYGLRIEAQ